MATELRYPRNFEVRKTDDTWRITVERRSWTGDIVYAVYGMSQYDAWYGMQTLFVPRPLYNELPRLAALFVACSAVVPHDRRICCQVDNELNLTLEQMPLSIAIARRTIRRHIDNSVERSLREAAAIKRLFT